jgi:toxin-antitoxin system PIN domain toxin
MTSLSFPDLNVWHALSSIDHVHHSLASRWWEQKSGRICFTRWTQLGFLRLATTAAAMNEKPLTMAEAWSAYDWFFRDDKVIFFPEPLEVEAKFRQATSGPTVSPKIWADAWLLAVAEAASGVLVTFDKALGKRGAHCLLGEK